MSLLIRLLLTCFAFVAFCGTSGCAVEVENPGKPTSDKKDSMVPASDRGISSSPNSSPEVFAPCSYTLGRKAAGSSGLEGAIVRIEDSPASSQAEMFVYVGEQSGYINVKDVAFAPSGVPAGSYAFVVTRPAVASCSVTILVSPSDIAEKIEISVRLDD